MVGMADHRFLVTTSTNGLLFECEQGCGRRLVVDRAGRMTVLDRGDQLALHRGSTGDLELGRPTLHQD